MYHKIAPMFLVEDVDKAAQWYTSTFGAKLLAKLPERPPFEWVSLTVGDVEIMFAQKQSAQNWYSKNVTISQKPSNFVAYVYVDDASELYDTIRDRVKVILAPIDQEYGIREFAIQDPFGIILVFAQIL